MSADCYGWSVGDTVFVENMYRRHGNIDGHEAKITKIARKWIYLDDGNKFDPETDLVDAGHYSPDMKVHASFDAYKETTRLYNEWSDFKRSICHTPPSGMTIEKLNQIKKLIEGETP